MGPEVLAGSCRASTRRCWRRSTPTRTPAAPTLHRQRRRQRLVETWPGARAWRAGSGPATRSTATACFTGRIDGPFVYGEGKVEAMRAFAAEPRDRPWRLLRLLGLGLRPADAARGRQPGGRQPGPGAGRGRRARGLAGDALRALGRRLGSPRPWLCWPAVGRPRRLARGAHAAPVPAAGIPARRAAAWRLRLSRMAVEPGSSDAPSGCRATRAARARGAVRDHLRAAGRGPSTPEDGRRRPRARPRLPRRAPLHPRGLPVDVPRPALDDAPVRRLRHRRGDQRALPLPARPRPDGALDRVRHADPDGATTPITPARSARSGARASRSTPSTT